MGVPWRADRYLQIAAPRQIDIISACYYDDELLKILLLAARHDNAWRPPEAERDFDFRISGGRRNITLSTTKCDITHAMASSAIAPIRRLAAVRARRHTTPRVLCELGR